MLTMDESRVDEHQAHVQSSKRAVRGLWATLFASFIALAMFAGCSWFVSDYRYQPQALQLAGAVKDILVRHQLCQTREQCSSREIVFVTPESWGLAIELYGLSDSEVLVQIFDVAAASFLQLPKGTVVKLQVYEVSKAEQLRAAFFKKPKPVMELRWEH